jgi:hypothetical protein
MWFAENQLAENNLQNFSQHTDQNESRSDQLRLHQKYTHLNIAQNAKAQYSDSAGKIKEIKLHKCFAATNAKFAGSQQRQSILR